MGATSDERLKILQMLEEEKITAEEAATLLRALEGGRRARPDAPGVGGEHRFLRIQVTDLASGTGKVNVTVPLGLVQAGLRIAEQFAPDFGDLDFQEIIDLIAEGTSGKIIEVVDAEDNERVEIYVE
jgi:hypothetical protein